MVGRQLPFFSVLIPAYLIVLLAGWRRMIEVLAGGARRPASSFAVVQFAVSNFVGPELTDTLAALVSLGVASPLLLRVWHPRDGLRRRHDAARGRRVGPTGTTRPARVARRVSPPTASSWSCVLVGQIGNFAGLPHAAAAGQRDGAAALRPGRQPPVPRAVDRAAGRRRPAGIPVPGVGLPLAGSVSRWRTASLRADRARAARSVAASSPYPLTFRLDFLATAGTLVLWPRFVAFVPMLVDGCRAARLRPARSPDARAAAPADRHHRVHPVDCDGDELLGHDLVDGAGAGRRPACCSRSSRRSSGMLGVFLTGSDTSSNTLFGPLQATTAQRVGARSDPDGRHQQLGRRDGQDDQPAEPVGRAPPAWARWAARARSSGASSSTASC